MFTAGTSLPECSVPAEPGFAETIARLFPETTPSEGAQQQESAAGCRRKKLWEIPAMHHCVVIGTCLSMPELRRLARQAGVDAWGTATDYELHRTAVSAAGERSQLATLMHKVLEHKFPLALRRFPHTMGDEELRAGWKEALARGEVAGALWAVMTHPSASERTLNVTGEQLHMLSHQVGAASRADLRQLATLKQENAVLKEQLQCHAARSAEQFAEKDTRIAALEACALEARAAQRRSEQVEAQLHALEGDNLVADLRRAVAALTRRAQRAEARMEDLAEANARCERLERELASANLKCEATERALQCVHAERSVQGSPGPVNLNGRCILCVGGRVSLVDQYRLLIEQSRGHFVHHDGGVENNVGRLQALLAGADAVICQAGNVSHAAYYVVKRYCKQHGTPCIMLKNGALSSFQKGLHALAGTEGQASASTIPTQNCPHDAERMQRG